MVQLAQGWGFNVSGFGYCTFWKVEGLAEDIGIQGPCGSSFRFVSSYLPSCGPLRKRRSAGSGHSQKSSSPKRVPPKHRNFTDQTLTSRKIYKLYKRACYYCVTVLAPLNFSGRAISAQLLILLMFKTIMARVNLSSSLKPHESGNNIMNPQYRGLDNYYNYSKEPPQQYC